MTRKQQLLQLSTYHMNAWDANDEGRFQDAMESIACSAYMVATMACLPAAIRTATHLNTTLMGLGHLATALEVAQMAVAMATAVKFPVTLIQKLGNCCVKHMASSVLPQVPEETDDSGEFPALGTRPPPTQSIPPGRARRTRTRTWDSCIPSWRTAQRLCTTTVPPSARYRTCPTKMQLVPLHQSINNRLMQERHLEAAMEELSIAKRLQTEVMPGQVGTDVFSEAGLLTRMGRKEEAYALLERTYAIPDKGWGEDDASQMLELSRLLVQYTPTPAQQHRWLPMFMDKLAAWRREPTCTACRVCSLPFAQSPPAHGSAAGPPEVHITGCRHVFHHACFDACRKPNGTIDCPECAAHCVVTTGTMAVNGPQGEVVPLRKGKEAEDLEDITAQCSAARVAVQARLQAASSGQSPAAAAQRITSQLGILPQPESGSGSGRAPIAELDVDEWLPASTRQFLGPSSSASSSSGSRGGGGRRRKKKGTGQGQRPSTSTRPGEPEKVLEPDPFQGLPPLPALMQACKGGAVPPASKAFSGDDCSVCLEPLDNAERGRDTLVALPACHHLFHELCWRQIMANHSRKAAPLRCCMCRAEC
eukprot:jgi/Tetstr1/454342/TSEL_004020.t1